MTERSHPVAQTSFLENHPHMASVILPALMGLFYLRTKALETFIDIPQEVVVGDVEPLEPGASNEIDFDSRYNRIFIPTNAAIKARIGRIQVKVYDLIRGVGEKGEGGAVVDVQGKRSEVINDTKAIQAGDTRLRVTHHPSQNQAFQQQSNSWPNKRRKR